MSENKNEKQTAEPSSGESSARLAGSVSPTVKVDPVMEAIAKKLFGINMVPRAEQSKMIRRAAKAGAEALKKQNDKLSLKKGE